MTRHHAFPPIADEQANVLILGSMPSAASLQAHGYYAHPRNAFWTIMGTLFGAHPELAYPQRQAILLANHIAVWDVLNSCYRQGSLDSHIDMDTIQTNNFAAFFSQYPAITDVFFNGGTAEKIYRQHILPVLTPHFGHLQYQRLPSTSPTFAAMGIPQKIAAWQVIKERAHRL